MKNSSPSENVHPWGDPKRFSLQLAFSLCSFVFIYSFVVVFRGAMSHPPPRVLLVLLCIHSIAIIIMWVKSTPSHRSGTPISSWWSIQVPLLRTAVASLRHCWGHLPFLPAFGHPPKKNISPAWLSQSPSIRPPNLTISWRHKSPEAVQKVTWKITKTAIFRHENDGSSKFMGFLKEGRIFDI